jgi:hypothetical protein
MCRPSRSRIEFGKVVIAAVFLGTLLAGCSDIYSDRRETISPIAGDALAANRVAQMIDPWSKASANNNIVYSGEKMQTAYERYRTGRIIRPTHATTSSLNYSQSATGGQASSASDSASSVK